VALLLGAILALAWPGLVPTVGRWPAAIAIACLAPLLHWLLQRIAPASPLPFEQLLAAVDLDAEAPVEPMHAVDDLDAALYTAARGGRVDRALALLDAGANAHALPPLDSADQRTLPMLAAFLDEPFNASPYAPVSRLYWNEFYLDVTKIPELAQCPAAQALLGSAEFRRQLEAARRQSLVDYRKVMALKRFDNCAGEDFPPTERAFVTGTTPDGFRSVRLDGSNLKVSVFENPAAVVASLRQSHHSTQSAAPGEDAKG
jgi:hypothetical protein